MRRATRQARPHRESGLRRALHEFLAVPLVVILGFIVLWPKIPAWFFLIFWFVSQFFISPSEGVASWAHVGGFLFGVAAGLVWRATSPPPQPADPYFGNPYRY